MQSIIGFAISMIFEKFIFGLQKNLIRELIHGGSLSLHNMVSCGIK